MRSIFSTYSAGENRITSTILAVFQKINIDTVNIILQGLFDDADLGLVNYQNQIVDRNYGSIPDGRISGLFDFYIETKAVPNAIQNTVQIDQHLNYLFDDERINSKLLVLTPDYVIPECLDGHDNRITWTNFDTLVSSIENALEDSIISEREKYLLLELKTFIFEENLLSENPEGKVLIIPARTAWPFYQQYFAYKCQPNRSFQRTSHIAFYCNNRIYNIVPSILGMVEQINFETVDLNDIDIVCFNDTPREYLIDRLTELQNNNIEQTLHGG